MELYPEAKVNPVEKSRLLGECLEGEEQILHNQSHLYTLMSDLIQFTLWNGADFFSEEDKCNAAEAVIKGIITDGNYCVEHHSMAHICFRKAELAAKAERLDEALQLLKQAVYHAKEYDIIDNVSPGVYRYTAPLLDRYYINSAEWFRTGYGTQVGDIREMCGREVFNTLRETAEFQALFE